MTHRITTALVAALSVALLATAPARAAGDRAATDEAGFTILFDKDHREGWAQAGPGGFDVDAAGVATAKGGMGLWYYEKQKFKNFVLRLEFQQKDINSNSGVYVRFPRVDGDPWIPVKEGYEIQIAGDQPSTHTTGSIYSFQAATDVPLKPAGEWNEYEIACVGQNYTVRLNGKVINTYTGDRATEGMVGVQNHDDDNSGANIVSYRNIRVKELPDDAAAYHVLFDGTEAALKNWTMVGPGAFELKDGGLTTTGGMGLFVYQHNWKDFVLTLDYKVTDKSANSGVFVRFKTPTEATVPPDGYEVQIADTYDATHRTGSIYSIQDSTDVPKNEAGEWNHYEISMVGQKYTVKLNGKVVNEFTGDRSLEGGVGLQNHDPESVVTFRDVRVVELKRE